MRYSDRTLVGIRYADIDYRFLVVDFEHAFDGSLYLQIDAPHRRRTPTVVRHDEVPTVEAVSRPLKISYHASGQVNFDGPRHPSIYCDPIYNIKKRTALLYFQLPDPTKLHKLNAPLHSEQLIHVPAAATFPYGMEVSLDPFLDWQPSSNVLMSIAVDELFRVTFSHVVGPRPGFASGHQGVFIMAVPARGYYPAVALDGAAAAAAFHQRRGAPYCIHLGDGRYRYFLPHAMCRAPRATAYCAPGVVCKIDQTWSWAIQFALEHQGKPLISDAPLSLVDFTLEAEL